MMTTTKTKGSKAARASKTGKTQAPKADPKAKAKRQPKGKAPAAPAVTPAAVTMIPLAQLVASPDNVRKAPAEKIPEFADNIAAVGLLSSLIVTPAGEGTYAVAAGERRRQALVLLHERGQIPADYAVPCRILTEGATEASVSENIHRERMNPADQFEAWAKLADEGLTPAEIARRHGTTLRIVNARLRLGRLSPRILAALRAGEIDEPVAQAFCWTEDHTAQEAAFDTISQGHPQRLHPQAVRRLLTEKDAELHDPRLQFVGEDAYRAAGGAVREDLFGEARTFPDTALLSRLCTEKLAEKAEILKGEGWGRVVASIEHQPSETSGMVRLDAQDMPLSEEDEAERNRLEALLAELEAADAGDERVFLERAACEDALDQIEERRLGYAPEDKARATLFVWLVHGGETYAVPYVPPMPAPADHVDGEGGDDDAPGETDADRQKPEAAGPRYSAVLKDDLAAIRRVTLQADFLAIPDIAQDLLRFHLVRNVLFEGLYYHSPLNCRANEASARIKTSAGEMGRVTAHARIEDAVSGLRLEWAQIADKAESFRVFRGLDEADKVALMAYVTALSLNGSLPGESYGDAALEAAVAEMRADPAVHWTPDETFFGRLGKAHILALMRELFGLQIADKHGADKKARLAERMAFYFDDSRSAAERGLTEEAAANAAAWTPEPMRAKAPAAQE